MTSCATIFTGTKDTISFDSNVPKTKVMINGMERCQTKVKRILGTETVTFVSNGYQAKTIELDSKFNGVSVINLFNILGWGIDLGTGAVNKYDQKFYNVELEKRNRSSMPLICVKTDEIDPLKNAFEEACFSIAMWPQNYPKNMLYL